MALHHYDVEVFDINNEVVSTPRYNKKVQFIIDTDPQGYCIKFVDDHFQILLESTVSSLEYCRVGPTSFIFSFLQETLLLTFSSIEDAEKFSTTVTKVTATKCTPPAAYLSHQQYIWQDSVMVSTYQTAILSNSVDFKDKVILDVGAGIGMLSFFAAQAGAKRIYTLEASTMAHFAQKLVDSNQLSDHITVITGKIEEVELPEKVDVIVCNPMGYMLYDGRMIDSYLYAKKWLSPGGKMYPSKAELHIVPFTDECLYTEQYNKARFWSQKHFCRVDLSPVYSCAFKEYFGQPVIDTFNIGICLSRSVRHVVDFPEADATDTINIPLEFLILESGTCHGLAFWFDVAFAGSQRTVWLSTAPTEPLTHWYQVRGLLEDPIVLRQGQTLSGMVVLIANKQSYDVTIDLGVKGTHQTSKSTLNLKNPYFR